MHPKIHLFKKEGFTLIKIMASLVIIGVLSSVGVQKHDQISDSASQRALEYAHREINSRELLTWALVKFSDEGWQSDESLFTKLDTKLLVFGSWLNEGNDTYADIIHIIYQNTFNHHHVGEVGNQVKVSK